MEQNKLSARQGVSEDTSQDRCVMAWEAVQADTSEPVDKNNFETFFSFKEKCSA